MELSEMKSIWQAYDNKLEKTLKLNLHCLEMIQTQKVKSRLTPLLWFRIAEIIVHTLIIWWLAGFLYNNFFKFQFAASAIALIVFFVIAFVNCLKQIIIIKQIDYSDNVIAIQSSLVMLQAHTLNYFRLSFLCMPIYLTYPIIGFKALGDVYIVSQFSRDWWTGQLIFNTVLIPVCIWLYTQITYKNIHKKWVKYIIKNSVGNAITKALEFVKRNR